MSTYSRPFHKSSRVRHFAAGAGVCVVLFSLVAASRVAIDPMSPREPLGVVVDVLDIPCDEPFDEAVEVIPDTLNGNSRIHIVVRNRACCCCGAEGDMSESWRLRGEQRRGAEPRPSRQPQRVSPERESLPDTSQIGRVVRPSSITPIPPAAPATRPLAGVGAPPPTPSPAQASRAKIPWWLALGAGALYFVTGREDRPPGGVCEDDEVGHNSGPQRTGCWPATQAPFSVVRRVL